MAIEVVEDKTLKPGQCHMAGCKNLARHATTRIGRNKAGFMSTREKAGKKTRRGKMLFCRDHLHVRNEMPKKVLRGITSGQVVQHKEG